MLGDSFHVIERIETFSISSRKCDAVLFEVSDQPLFEGPRDAVRIASQAPEAYLHLIVRQELPIVTIGSHLVRVAA